MKVPLVSTLNYLYQKQEKKNNVDDKIPSNPNPNRYNNKKLYDLFSKFPEIESINLRAYYSEIINNETENTLDYHKLDNELIIPFEKKRNEILKIIITGVQPKYENFKDTHIFKSINIIDRYI